MPLISSLTRSASARAACSRSSASRSCWRRTPLGHVADEARDERLSLDLDLRDGRLGGEAAAVAAQELDVVALGRHDPRRLDEGPPALVVALAELGRRDQRAHRHAHGLGGGPAEEPFGRRVPGRDHPVAVERDEGVGSAVEHQSRARLALLHRTRAALGVLHARPDPREQARDQQARHQRRADCEQPEHHRTRGLDQRSARSRSTPRSGPRARAPRRAGRSRRRTARSRCTAAGRGPSPRRSSSQATGSPCPSPARRAAATSACGPPRPRSPRPSPRRPRRG